jgi:hypothetical protein
MPSVSSAKNATSRLLHSRESRQKNVLRKLMLKYKGTRVSAIVLHGFLAGSG